ncbi:hypothetical protein EMIT0194P_180012 [Pseudomonas serbica]
MAALAMTISTRPQACIALSTRRCNSSLLPILQGTAMASPPSARISAAACSQASALRPEITTFAPCAAIPLALASPKPRLEPVIIATLPCRSNKEDAVIVTSYFYSLCKLTIHTVNFDYTLKILLERK